MLLYFESGILSVAYLTVVNLPPLGISVHWRVSVKSQYLIWSLYLTGGHTIQPPIEGLLPPTGVEPTQFWNSSSKEAVLQAHITTLDKDYTYATTPSLEHG